MSDIDLEGFDDIVPLGSGGLGDVYRATRRSTGGDVAIKVLRDWSDHDVAMQRAERELRALVDLRGHSNVVNVEEVVESDGQLSIVMEYAPGGSISDLLKARGGKLPFGEALLVGAHTAAALAAAHDRGIIHRDIKPHNLLIGAFGQVKVCDFGIASLTRSEAVADRTSSLSLRYASPEELRGEQEVGTASDIYSLAATLHQLLTGQYLPLPDGTAGSLPLRSWVGPDDVAADVEVEFRSLVQRCADRVPANRPTAHELHDRFEEFAGRLGSARVRKLPLVALGLDEAIDPDDPQGAAPVVPSGGAATAAAAAAGAAGAAAAATGPAVTAAAPQAGPGAGPAPTVVNPAAAAGGAATTTGAIVGAAGAAPTTAMGAVPPGGGVPPSAPPVPPDGFGSSSGEGRKALAVFAVLALLLVGGVLAFALGWVGGDDESADAASTSAPTETTIVDTSIVDTTLVDSTVSPTTASPTTTSAPVTTVAVTTTAAPTTVATTTPPTTAAPTTTTTTVPPRYDGRKCPGDGACIEMQSISLIDGEYWIGWQASFVPDVGGTHAHFFWDIYQPSQVGSASADQAPWELTADQRFVPSGEMSIANRPPGATGICVTAADGAHAVIDPEFYHCALIEAGDFGGASPVDLFEVEDFPASG